MASWRKVLLGLIAATLLVLIVVFWGTMLGCCLLIACIQGGQFFAFKYCASRELAKTFQEEGEHVKGWRPLG